MRSKELSVELRDRIVSRHRSGEGSQNNYAALKVTKNTVASNILKWKRKALVREVTNNRWSLEL
jgi:hypothetical protein